MATQDLILDIEVKITARPVAPRPGKLVPGPREKNLMVVRDFRKTLFHGEKQNLAELAENAVLAAARQWALADDEPPEVSVMYPDMIDDDEADIRGHVHSHGVSTAISIEYGTTPECGNSANVDESPLSDDEWKEVNVNIDDLSADTLYYYRLKCVSDGGTVYSNTMVFKTLPETE